VLKAFSPHIALSLSQLNRSINENIARIKFGV